MLSKYPALGFPLYRRYWLASLASVGGWQISAVAMGWLVFELSGSTLDLGILGAATALPAIVMTFAGGVIADRFEKRWVLIITTLLNALLLLILALLAWLKIVDVWHVWLIAGGISVISGVDWPTRQSFFPHLIDRNALLSAVALNSVLWQATRMIVPAFGGLLLAVYDPSLVFVLAALGYLVMLVVISRIDVSLPGEAHESPLQQIRIGLKFIAGHAFFRNLILLSYLTMLFLSSYMQLMPAFADLLGAGPTGFGILMSATGLGSILGTILSGSLSPGENYGRVMLGGAITAAFLLMAFALASLSGSYPLALLFALLAATGTSMFLILSTTALQAEVPDALRGRVMGIHGITYSLMPLGALLTGAIANVISTPLALIATLSLYLLLVGWIIANNANLRRLTAPQA